MAEDVESPTIGSRDLEVTGGCRRTTDILTDREIDR